MTIAETRELISKNFPLLEVIEPFAYGQKGIPVYCVNNQLIWHPEYSTEDRPVPITFHEVWGIIVPDIRATQQNGYVFLGIDGSDLQFALKPNIPATLLDMSTAKFDITQDLKYQDMKNTPTVASIIRRNLQAQIQFNPATARKLQDPRVYLQQVSERLAVREASYQITSRNSGIFAAFLKDAGADFME